MKLTNTIRAAFVRAVMNDVPSVDYQPQADKLVNDMLDADFQKVAPGLSREALEASGWLSQHYVDTPGTLSNVRAVAPGHRCAKHNADVWAKLTEISVKKANQDLSRAQLQSKLTGCANSVTTRKALASLLPEFEKYLPADDAAASRTLPVVQNVVADFVKAGWPK